MDPAYLLLTGALLLPAAASARNSLVTSLPGVSAEDAAALSAAGVRDTRRLYQKTRAPSRRLERLVRKTGLPQERLERLATLADLCRLYRITPRIAEVLRLAGVGSLADLARRDAAELFARTNEIARGRRITEHPPTRAQLAGWTKDAARVKPNDWEQLRGWATVR